MNNEKMDAFFNRNKKLTVIVLIIFLTISVVFSFVLLLNTTMSENIFKKSDDVITIKRSKKVNEFKIGDYIKMTPTSTSYTITTAMTGYSEDQTINPSELNLWRVISINSDGTIDLVSEYVSSTNVYFKGKTGYQNLVSSLNQIASQYTNSKYTVASRHMGYNGQTGIITDTSVLDSTTIPWTSETLNSTNTSDEAKGGGDIGYKRDVDLVKTALGTTVANTAGTTIAGYYWLASRYFDYSPSAPTDWDFGCRFVDDNGVLTRGYLCIYFKDHFIVSDKSLAIRPIVTIKSAFESIGSGTRGDPYILD